MAPLVFPHLTGRLHFWYYQAPPGRWHVPRQLEAGIEEIEVIVSGHGYFEVNGRVVDAGPGSNLWYQTGDKVIVTSHAADPYETIVFRFEVKQPATPAPPGCTTWSDTGECARFCRRALALSRLGVEQTAELVFCHYARLRWEAQECARADARQPFPPPLQRAVRLLETRFAEELDVAAVARGAGVSASHLHLLFRRHLGTSPAQVLINQRLQRAQDALTSSDRSIKEICYAVGFRDVAYFGALFKRRTSLTPGNYRRRFAAVPPH